MQDTGDAARQADLLDDLVTRIVPSLTDDTPPASAVRFLLLHHLLSGRGDLGERLETVLARSVERALARELELSVSTDWLLTFVDAALASDDRRLQAGVSLLARDLAQTWRTSRNDSADLAPAMRTIEACLAALALEGLAERETLAQAAIDELERRVAASYRPGAGMTSSRPLPAEPVSVLADHVGTASALLTAYRGTGRLPYSMLAEELMRHALKTAWPATDGNRAREHDDERVMCESRAAVVLTRIAALHADGGYRDTAVFHEDADYAREAGLLLVRLGDELARADIASLSEYGLALYGWLELH